MRRTIAAVAFLALALPMTRADEKADAAKKLDGTYEVTAYFVAGKPDDKKKDKVTVTIKDGTIAIQEGEKKNAETAKFGVDPVKKPAHFDIMPGRETTDIVAGIYEAKETDKGLELTIAFQKGKGNPRPTDFKGEGENAIVLKLLRKKDK